MIFIKILWNGFLIRAEWDRLAKVVIFNKKSPDIEGFFLLFLGKLILLIFFKVLSYGFGVKFVVAVIL